MNELLSICIPTYNRAEYLNDCLKSLLPQVARYDIIIFVSDNASTDATAQVVENYKKIYPNIVYSRNEKNMGPDFNFTKALRISKTKYSWLLGDDDRIADGAITKLLSILYIGDHDMVIVNGGKNRNEKITGRVNDQPTKIFNDQNDLLASIGWHMTWMSCLVFSAKVINEANFEKFFDTNFLQFSVVFDTIAGKNISVYWESEPYVYGTSSNLPAWLDIVFKIFITRWHNALFVLPQSYTQSSKIKAQKDHGVNSRLFTLKNFVFFRIMGAYNLSVYNKYKQDFGFATNVPKIALFLIALMPVPRFLSVFLMKHETEIVKIKRFILK